MCVKSVKESCKCYSERTEYQHHTGVIITSGAVRPDESWKAVAGPSHALAVPIAVVCALGDRVCR